MKKTFKKLEILEYVHMFSFNEELCRLELNHVGNCSCVNVLVGKHLHQRAKYHLRCLLNDSAPVDTPAPRNPVLTWLFSASM